MTVILETEAFVNLSENWWDLVDTDRQVLRILQVFYSKSDNPRIQPRRQWIADKVGTSVVTISRSLSRLREQGWLVTRFRGRKGNRYELPDWLKKLDLKRPDKWLEMPIEQAEKVFTNVKQTIENIVKKFLNDTVSDTINDTIYREHNYRTGEPNRLDNTGGLGASGNVHESATRAHSHDSDLGFFHRINLEPKAAIDVANDWRDFRFEDGTIVTDFDMKCWLKHHGPLATHGAMIAYRYEIERRAVKGTVTRVPGIRFVQHMLTTGNWRRTLQGARNRSIAMCHLQGKNKAFYRVNYSSAYLSPEYAIELEVTNTQVFTDIIRHKTGIEPNECKGWFKKYLRNK